jgi:flavodoxin
MSNIQTKPHQILIIWKSIYGPLPASLEIEFLKSEEVQRLSYFSWEIIKKAINSKAKTLTEVVQEIELLVSRDEFKEKSRMWIRENFTEAEAKAQNQLQPGTYKLLNKIYSVRNDRKSSKHRVLYFDPKLKKYVKLLYKFEETRILETLKFDDRLTLEQAIKLSNEWGICCHCGRILTATRSVGKGMGPICEQHYK